MPRLSVESFLCAGSDIEMAQYRVLSSLKSYSDDFNHNRLYPGLMELIELKASLESLLEEQSKFLGGLPRAIKKLDLENTEIEYEQMDLSCPPVDHVMHLIEWALEPITKTVEEGTSIYDFVEENLVIKEVGILPLYHDEGYCFVPDNHSSLLYIFSYHLSVYESGQDKYRSLTTRTIRSLDLSCVHTPPESIKLDLIEQLHEYPNPATYLCETDLDFAFAETILPVAKRKLMMNVAA
jgi:hypothetical protein